MTIQELITELEAAKSPSFVLDGQIQSVLLPDREGMMPPNYSASVDAGIRLMQIVLPGWRGSVQFGNFGGTVNAYICADEAIDDHMASHNVPAIALCISILEAKQAQEVLA